MLTTRRAVSLRAESYHLLVTIAAERECSCSALVERLIGLEAKRCGLVPVPPPPPRPEPDLPQHMEF